MSTTRASGLVQRVVHARCFRAIVFVLLSSLMPHARLYVLGLAVVIGDTNAHYLSDADYWWNHGGILDPPEWVPYTWMGRPCGSNLQDGSYVLAQGIGNLVSSWSPTVSAITSAVLTAFGALGMYLLVRRLWGNHYVALLALVAQFYAPNIFSNAQFLDFHRATVYLPWFLLILSPLWFWERRWGLTLAALLLWQIIVGSYRAGSSAQPFELAWAVAGCSTALATTGASGALRWPAWSPWRSPQSSSSRRCSWAPAYATRRGSACCSACRYLALIFFPYDNSAMTWDIALRPIFVVVPVLVLMVLARWTSVPIRPVSPWASARWP